MAKMERSFPRGCDDREEAQVGEAPTEEVEYCQRGHGVLFGNAGLMGVLLVVV